MAGTASGLHFNEIINAKTLYVSLLVTCLLFNIADSCSKQCPMNQNKIQTQSVIKAMRYIKTGLTTLI